MFERQEAAIAQARGRLKALDLQLHYLIKASEWRPPSDEQIAKERREAIRVFKKESEDAALAELRRQGQEAARRRAKEKADLIVDTMRSMWEPSHWDVPPMSTGSMPHPKRTEPERITQGCEVCERRSVVPYPDNVWECPHCGCLNTPEKHR